MKCPTVPWDCKMGWTIYAISRHLWRGSCRPDIDLTSIKMLVVIIVRPSSVVSASTCGVLGKGYGLTW